VFGLRWWDYDQQLDICTAVEERLFAGRSSLREPAATAFEKSILRDAGAIAGRHSSRKMGPSVESNENPLKTPGDNRCAF